MKKLKCYVMKVDSVGSNNKFSYIGEVIDSDKESAEKVMLASIRRITKSKNRLAIKTMKVHPFVYPMVVRVNKLYDY